MDDWMKAHIVGRLVAEVQREVEATFANLPSPTFEDCAADVARRLDLLAGNDEDPARQVGAPAEQADGWFRKNYHECDANPSGVHGPLRGGYDPEMPEGFATVECAACGLATGIPIPDAADLTWD